MNIIELLEYARKHHKHGKMFKSKDGWQVFVDDSGFSIDTAEETQTIIWFNETFEVEVEEVVDADGKFRVLVEVTNHDANTCYFESINTIINDKTQRIYALLDGELKLVWKKPTSTHGQ